MKKIKKIVIFCLLLCSQKQALCFDSYSVDSYDRGILIAATGGAIIGLGIFSLCCSDNKNTSLILITTGSLVTGIASISMAEECIQELLDIKRAEQQTTPAIKQHKKSLFLLSAVSLIATFVLFNSASNLNESIRK